MDYKDLRNKTVFDFTDDEVVLTKVTGWSADPMKGFSKEYILGYPAIVHAQMLQKLAAEINDNELLEAAEKLEAVLWKEQHELSNKLGCIID